MIFLTIVQNIALLVSLSILHNQIMRRWERDSLAYPILSGLLFGGVGLVGMMTPLRLMPGIIFDGRSIILSTAGFFGGPIAGGIAAVICAAYRIWLGGAGAIMGVSVIAESTCLGILFHNLRRRRPQIIHPLSLLGFGFLVHLVMLALTSTISGGASRDVFYLIALPVLTAYPVGTLLVCLLFLDQEARLDAQKALRESEQSYREIFNSTHEAIFVLDVESACIVDVNDQLMLACGYTCKEELIGQNVNILNSNVSSFNQEAIRRNIRKTLEEGPQLLEWLVKRRNGDQFWSEMSLRKANLGGVVRLLVVARDITERKRAEEERVRLEEQLRHALKMESIGRLAGGVAHDFNNMLGVIVGHAEIALAKIDPTDPMRQHFWEIQKAAQRSAGLTRQLLAFARKQSVIPKVLDLNEVISGMQKMLQRLIGENIELIWNPGADLWPVRMDPSQIDQILANLTVNSRDAIENVGTILVSTSNQVIEKEFCESHTEFVPGEYVLLTVSDTGSGMDREILEHVFEPFYTTKEIGKGAGLGLATVYGIVEQNGGIITLASKPEEGTTIEIYLPRCADEAVEVAEEPIKKEPVKGCETVLLVEDEDMILNLGRSVLEQNGYTVLIARRPSEAIALAESRPDELQLLITDIVMPEMNGKDLCDRLRAVKPGLKCLFMSGYTADIIATRGALEEGVHFIQKPFSPLMFTAKVREALEG